MSNNQTSIPAIPHGLAAALLGSVEAEERLITGLCGAADRQDAGAALQLATQLRDLRQSDGGPLCESHA